MKTLTLLTYLFILSPNVVLRETINDLVERDGLYCKRFTNVPFSGTLTGQHQGTCKNGKEDGPWVEYRNNVQLKWEGTYKNGKKEGPWVSYYDNGQLEEKETYKDGVKVK